MESNYLDILTRDMLNYIKIGLKRKVILESGQESITDKKMLEVIKDIFKDYNILYTLFSKEKKEGFSIRDNGYILNSLSLYYMALYNDNVSLLQELLANNVIRISTEFWSYEDFCFLDKRIASQFTKDEYIDILDGNQDIFRCFYQSLYRKEDKETEFDANKVIEKFCNVLKKNKNIAYNENAYHKRSCEFLNILVLTNFSEEEILDLDNYQKVVLNKLEYKNEKEQKLLIDLIKNYNYKFSRDVYWLNFATFAKYFNAEEMNLLTSDERNMFDAIFREPVFTVDRDEALSLAVEKVREIKKINPSFNSILNCHAYQILTKEQIMNLSHDAVEKINEVVRNFERCFHDDEELKKLNHYIKLIQKSDYVKEKTKRLFKGRK